MQILSTLLPSDKLGTEGSTTFDVYKPGAYNSVVRRVRGECRVLNVSRLEQCVHHATAHLAALYYELHPSGPAGLVVAIPSHHVNEERTLRQLVLQIQAAAAGLVNLQQTYVDDVSTAARIKALTDRIEHCFTVLDVLGVG